MPHSSSSHATPNDHAQGGGYPQTALPTESFRPRGSASSSGGLATVLCVVGFVLALALSIGLLVMAPPPSPSPTSPVAAGADTITAPAATARNEGLAYRLTGVLGLLLCFTLGPIAVLLVKAGSQRVNERSLRAIEDLGDSVRRLHETSAMSPDARRVLNRRQERDLLCAAIEEDMNAQAWDAAIVLCNELAGRFGYRADAEEYRTRIESARAEVMDRRVTDAIARLDGLIVQRRWDVAVQEAARIVRLFPDSHRVENLRQRVEQARAVYKQDLERRFLQAAHDERIDEAMTLLKELDAYLSENEAGPYREVARGVVTKARENLGAQFKLAVQNRDWRSATSHGRRIINEFPNTRMAEEVRAIWEQILAKANAAVSAPISTSASASSAASAAAGQGVGDGQI